MTKISFRFTQIGVDSTVYRSVKDYAAPALLDAMRQGETIEAEVWSGPRGFLARYSVGKKPCLLYAASSEGRVVYGYGSSQAWVGLQGYGTGIAMPVLPQDVVSGPYYFGRRPDGAIGPGENCRDPGCQQVYVHAQDAQVYRFRLKDGDYSFDFWGTHGVYRKTSGRPPVWVYGETDDERPSQALRTEILSISEVEDRGIPDWQKMVRKGAVLMTSNGKVGYALPSPNGVDPNVRFEKQNQFWAFRDRLDEQGRKGVLDAFVVGLAFAAALGVAALGWRRSRRAS